MKREKEKPTAKLEAQLLVEIARRLGPGLDQIDVDPAPGRVKVRDLVVQFSTDSVTPTQVRVALLELDERGWIGCGDGVLSPDAELHLKLHGLLAAREVEPGCGRSTNVVHLVMRRGAKAGLFDARFRTGDAGRDSGLNQSGLTLAAFYVFAVRKPTEEAPLLLANCQRDFLRLARVGVGPTSGPGLRLQPSLEGISKAIGRLGEILSIAPAPVDDGRRTAWFLRRGFPEVRVSAASGGQFRDWTWMLHNLGLLLQGRPFPDRAGRTVSPLSDADLVKLEREATS